MEETIQIGDLARDRITGFEGLVVTYSKHMHNADRASLQPRELKDGRPEEPKGFDVPMLTLLEKRVIPAPDFADHEFKLGDVAKDQLSECKGTIIALTQFISGCTQAILQPSDMKDGHPVQGIYFPVTQLEMVRQGATAESPETGGPVREARAYLL